MGTMSCGRLALVAVTLVGISALLQAQEQSSSQADTLEEVVVVGRQPGPPLWKVSNGDHTLWILPLVDMYPQKMEWDSARVEKLIAESQEYIDRPRVMNGVSLTNLLLIPRAIGLYNKTKRSEEQPDGRTLADDLPPDLYRRFAALKARYLPRDREIEKLNVGAAGRALQRKILERENLELLRYNGIDSPQLITGKMRKWLKANKVIRHTSTAHGETHALSGADLKALGRVVDEAKGETTSSGTQWERMCFEHIVTYFERDLEPVKKRANAWAQGGAEDLVSPTPLYGGSDSCRHPPMFVPGENPKLDTALEKLKKDRPALAAWMNAASDRPAMEKISKERWLAAAEAALGRNATTFALLAVDDVVGEDGLVARLQEKGYKVEVSAK
jgi:hypothetical protein